MSATVDFVDSITLKLEDGRNIHLENAYVLTSYASRVAYNRESAIDILGDNWELIADDYYNAIVSAVNLIDEQLEKPRLQNARKLLEEVKNQLENY